MKNNFIRVVLHTTFPKNIACYGSFKTVQEIIKKGQNHFLIFNLKNLNKSFSKVRITIDLRETFLELGTATLSNERTDTADTSHSAKRNFTK